MRKGYIIEDAKELGWGFDRIVGFFLQLYDTEAETVVLSMDQGLKLDKDLPFQEDLITYDIMVDMLSSEEEAFHDFQTLMKWPLTEPVKGYNLLNAKGEYRQPSLITTMHELFTFIDNIEEGYILTDFLDLKVNLSFIRDQLNEWERQQNVD